MRPVGLDHIGFLARICVDMPGLHEEILFLFGKNPSSPAVLEAAVLAGRLARHGCSVRWAAVGLRAALLLRAWLNKPVLVARGPWLGGLRRCGLPTPPAAVWAWEADAVEAAAASAGRTKIRAILSGPAEPGRLTCRRCVQALAAAERIICHSPLLCRELGRAGLSRERIRLLPPAVDPDVLAPMRACREAIRRRLGLAPQDQPVYVVPYTTTRDQGPFRAGWASLLVRKGLPSARLLLSGPGRGTARALRLAAACRDSAGFVVAPAGTPWLEILAAGDVVVVPGAGSLDPVAVAWAMAARVPVVAADLGEEPPLLDTATCLTAASLEPLDLARGMYRLAQDQELAAALTAAAADRVGRAADAESILSQMCSAASLAVATCR